MDNLVIELTKSKTGKHACRKMVFIVTKEGEIREAPPLRTCEECRTYSVGTASIADLSNVSDGDYIVYVRLVRNLRNRVNGEIIVYNSHMVPLFRAVYRKLKLRRTFGDARYSWIPRIIAEHIGLYVKRYNLD